jgi:hypothetical protein
MLVRKEFVIYKKGIKDWHVIGYYLFGFIPIYIKKEKYTR